MLSRDFDKFKHNVYTIRRMNTIPTTFREMKHENKRSFQ